MAATGVRSPVRERASARAATPRTGRPAREPLALAAAVTATAVYATFANGAIGMPEESRLQVGVAVLSFATLAALLFGRLRFAPARGAVAAVAALAGFAAWAALSITWSIAPDESWLELNRSLSYALLVLLGITLGSSLPRAAERVALGWLAIATAIALYAFAGKLFPWFSIPGVIDLNHTEQFSRLRAPLDYWNALGMVCALAIPIAVRTAAELDLRPRMRIAALLALALLLTTLALTYSRGGLLVLTVALGALLALGPGRARLAAAAGVGVAGAVAPVLTVLVLGDLTTDGLRISERSDDGVVLLLATAIGTVVVLLLGRRLVQAGAVEMPDRTRRRLRRAARVLAVAVPLVVLAGLALSDRGIRGTISHEAEEFTEPKFDRQNDPARVLRTNSGNRWIWWQEAAGAWWDRPLVGHGAGSFPLVHRAYREDAIEVRQPHSVPLDFLSETGLIGAALALGGLALLGLAAVRSVRVRAPGRQRAFGVAILTGALAWSLHLWVDWDWEIPGVTLPVLVMLGVLAARPAEGSGAPPPPPPTAGRRVALFGAGAAVVVIAALAAIPAIAQDMTDEALARAAGGTPQDLREAGEMAATAKRLNPLAVDAVFAQASIYERGNEPSAAGGLIAQAVERQPNNPATWSRLARYQVLIDDTRGVLESLVNLLRLDPARALTIAPLIAQYLAYDERRSASATGTPLPLEPAPPSPAPLLPTAPFAPPAAPAPAAPAPPVPTPNPSPPPAPRPRPTPPRETPTPPPGDGNGGGDPFRLEG